MATALLDAFKAHPGSVELPDGGYGGYCLLCGKRATLNPDWSCEGGCETEAAAEAVVAWHTDIWLPAQRNGQPAQRIQHEVTWDNTKKPPKPMLPPAPDTASPVDQAGWMTAVLNLTKNDPVISAQHQGLTGSSGQIELFRMSGDTIRFEPASKVAKALTFADELVWQLQPSDGEPYPWNNQQTIKIARVVRLLCGASKKLTARDEIESIVNTMIDAGEETVGHTYNTTTGQRYELATLLRPTADDRGNPIRHRYLIDLDTGEYVIRVGDLRRVARDLVGGVPHGWLDARMEALGWARCRFQGYGLPRKEGDRGPHARVDVYRGFLAMAE